jgi:hypothetical protein
MARGPRRTRPKLGLVAIGSSTERRAGRRATEGAIGSLAPTSLRLEQAVLGSWALIDEIGLAFRHATMAAAASNWSSLGLRVEPWSHGSGCDHLTGTMVTSAPPFRSR